MSGRSEKSGADRRGFLKLAGLSAILGGAALATGTGGAKAREEETENGLYRESEHVKTYYDLAAF